MSEPQIPSVGRIVHYVSRATCEPVCRAAVITEVGDWPPGTDEAGRRNIAVPVSVTVLLPDNTRIHPIMGCYGIGVNRILASAIEREGGHDENGIVWPSSIAPLISSAYFVTAGTSIP